MLSLAEFADSWTCFCEFRLRQFSQLVNILVYLTSKRGGRSSVAMAKIFSTLETDAAVKLMYYCSKVLGLIPFVHISKTSTFESKISLPCLTWTVFLVLFYSTGYIADFMYEISIYDRNSVYQAVGLSALFCSACSYPIDVLVLSVNRRNLVKVMDKLIQLDHTLRPTNSKKLIFVIFQLCIAFTLVASSTVHFWLNATACTSTILVMVPISFSVLVVECHFSNFVRLLTRHFSDINSVLEAACSPAKSRDVICTGSLRSTGVFMSLHDSVCDVSVLVNSIYSPIVLMAAGQGFLITVYVLYYTVARFLGFNTPEVNVAMHCTLLFCIMKLLNMVPPCYRCSCEVRNGNNTVTLIYVTFVTLSTVFDSEIVL